VLPAFSRVRSRSEHRLVAARGRRARRGPLVVQLLVPENGLVPASGSTGTGGQARAGVVVGKRVGTAVTRNLVKRRLRELLRSRLGSLPSGALVLVRALPGAGESSFEALARALDAALISATHRSPAAAVPR
jgi:ribonuclease P protein component